MTIDNRFKQYLRTEVCKLAKRPKLLDVGGPSFKLLRKVGIYKTIDWYCLNTSRSRMKSRKYLRIFVKASACDIPFQKGYFDVTFSHNVFEHINEPWRAAEECIRVTREGGLLIHSTNFSWIHHDPPDYYRYSHEGLAYLFERTNRVERIISEIGKHRKGKINTKRWGEYWKTVYIGRRNSNV